MAGLGKSLRISSILGIIAIAASLGAAVATGSVTATTVTPSSSTVTPANSVQSPISTPSSTTVTPSSSTVTPSATPQSNSSSTVESNATSVSPSSTTLLGITAPLNDTIVTPVRTTLEGVVTQLEFETGNITVVKQTDPDNSTQLFNFTGDFGSFTLGDGQNATFSGLTPGNYSIAELVPFGWFNFDRSCSFLEFPQVSSCNTNPAPATIEVNLAPGGNVLVEFGNEDTRGNITVVKQTDPDGSTEVFDFTGDLGNFTLTDGQNVTFTVPSGVYNIIETVPSGWFNDDRSCSFLENPQVSSCNTNPAPATIEVSLGSGGNIIVEFGNEDLEVNTGTITIIKQTSPDNSTQLFNFTVTGGPSTIGNFTLGDGQNVTFTVLPGNYTFQEIEPEGWNNFGQGCSTNNAFSSLNPTDARLRLHIRANGTASCTFDNEDIHGTITIAKETTPDNSTQLFNFTVTGGPSTIGNFTLGDGQNVTFTVLPGNYTFQEIEPEGWNNFGQGCSTNNAFSSLNPTDARLRLHIRANGTASCTFDNEGERGTIIVEKQTIPDGAAGSFTFTGDAAGTIGDNGTIVVPNLLPGNYSTTESDPAPFILTNIACNDTNSFWNVTARTATFVLEPGEVVKCTFTDTNVLVVEIDIKPGSDPNAINLKKDRIITVAILGNATFDVHDIDVSPLSDAPKFGGSTPKAPIRVSYKDVNNDGFTDLVLQYRLAQLGFTSASTEGCISGKLTDGTIIEGCDSVKIVPK